MTLFSRKLVAVSLGAVLFGIGAIAVQAQSVAPVPVTVPQASSPVALDPALKQMFMLLATSMLANFAASASSGSLDRFDPAPLIEQTVKTALGSRELNAALDRMVDQAGSTGANSADGAADSAMSPEVRALIKLALKSAVTVARNELAREFAPPAPSAAPSTAP